MGHVQKLGFYPSGGWGSGWAGLPSGGTGRNQPGGWIYQILPYMDQDTLHDLGKGGSLALSSSASAIRYSTAIPGLYCPTRRTAQAYPFTGTPMQTNTVTTAGRTDYAINGGSVYVANTGGPGSSPAPANFSWPNLKSFNGIATTGSQITEAGIPDNKETTYLVGEKYMSPENYMTGVDSTISHTDPGDACGAMSGDDVSLIRWGNATLLPSMDRTYNNNPPAKPSQIFGSSHGAGWHAAFCDGHVQLIAWGIDGVTHQAMATRNGHEVVDPSKIPSVHDKIAHC